MGKRVKVYLQRANLVNYTLRSEQQQQLRFFSKKLPIYIYRYNFTQDILQVVSTGPSIESYSRICIQSRGNNKYLVAHEQRGQTKGKYTCMQILIRGNSVLQLKQAKISTTLDSGLCSDNNLHLDGWLIIDTYSVMNQREDCSLNGGFNMQVYDKSTFTGVCDGYLGETRLESECLPGEGLNFYFRQPACIPDGLYMYPTQRTYCLANWDDEGFNFILLKHDRMTYMWLFRYPKTTPGEHKFIALLMKDLYASTENSIIVTNQYLRLTMSRQNAKTLSNLCYDDYEICSVLRDPCSYSEEVARTCARTCGFCSDTKPTVCQLDSSFYGTWVNSNHPDDIPDIQINATSIYVSGTETLHCIDWTNGTKELEEPMSTADFDDNHEEEQMVVTVSGNGCRPRFSCTKFTKFAKTFFMQFSKTRLWPLVQNKADNYTCNIFLYTSNKEIDKNPYRKKVSTLLLPSLEQANVSVDLSEFVNFDVHFKGGVQCSGNLTQRPLNDSAQFNVGNCPGQSLENTEFEFIEYGPLPFPTPDNDMLLITKTNNTMPITICWLFPEKPNNVFHMIASKDCNGAMKRKIRKGRLYQIATFIKTAPWTSITDNNTVEGSMQNNTTTLPSEVANGSQTPTLISQTVTSVANTSYNITTVEGDSKQHSILVVFGIIITFLTVQVGIYCNCS